MDVNDFLQGNIHQLKVASEATTFGWMDLLRIPLGSLGGISNLNIIQNERLNNL